MIPHLAEMQRATGVPTEVHWSRFAFGQGLTMRAILSYRASLSALDLPLGTVLHAHHPLAAIAARAWMRRVQRVLPLVLTVHGLPTPMERPLLKQALTISDVNVAVSRYLAKTLLQFPGASIHAVVYNGVDNERRFRPRPVISINRGIRIVSVSRLVPEKGVFETAEVFLELLRQRVPVRWTIVGDGPARDQLLRYLRRNGALRQAQWTGFQSHPEDWLERSNLFMLWSHEEAFGNAFVEANSVGLPTVASRVGGIVEHLTDDYNGITVDLSRRETICAASRRIAALYRTPRQWKELRYGAITRGKQFSLQKMADEYRTIYHWATTSTLGVDVIGR